MSAPLSLLICALGGDGGGVLAGWITRAAVASGVETLRTSIPGVAQRTGATTYYLEFANQAGRGQLQAAPGRVDVVVATELAELARAMSRHFVNPQRTHVISSTHRAYTISERMAPNDGRADSEAIKGAAQRLSKSCHLVDADALAKGADSRVNAVMLGVLAGSGALPIPASAFEDVLRSEGDGANLRGFRAGLAPPQLSTAPDIPTDARAWALGLDAIDRLPAAARDVARHGAQRLADYQGQRAARAYLAQLTALPNVVIVNTDLSAEIARRLALLATPDDIVRVAQLKTQGERMRQIRADAGARPGEPARVVDFFKPGMTDFLALAPAPVGRFVLNALPSAIRDAQFALRLEVTSPWGYLLMKSISLLRPFRPMSLLYRERTALIARWLETVCACAERSPALALEAAKSAELVKGYASTLERTQAAFQRVLDDICAPLLSGAIDMHHGVDALIQARNAGAREDDGRALQALIEALPRRQHEAHA